MFAAGVDIHGVHNWDRQGRAAPNLSAALAGDGITEADLREAARVDVRVVAGLGGEDVAVAGAPDSCRR